MSNKGSKYNITFMTSLVAVFFVTATYFYFNYKFSRYNYIDFNKIYLYSKQDIFKPKFDIYTLVIYSSKDMNGINDIESKIEYKYPVIAIDFYQTRYVFKHKIKSLITGTNTILSIVNDFDIEQVPAVLLIKRYKKDKFKQYSGIKYLN